MSLEENKASARCYFEDAPFNPAACDEIFAPFGINIFRIAGGKIAEVWDIFDRLWAWQQLGVLPEIKEALAKRREELLAQQSQPTI